MNVDILAIGAHPDDVELGVGGLLHKWAQRGQVIAILDLTRGEMSTRGTVEERAVEARNAAAILGAAHRENAGLPDGGVANTTEQQRKIIPVLRALRPRVILAPMTPDRHPDHAAAHDLARDANFFAGLAKIDTGQEPCRAKRMYYYHPYVEDAGLPPFVVDITGHFEQKLEALRAHASQFFNPNYAGPTTHIASESFWNSIRTRAEYWGSRIGTMHGEALYASQPLGVDFPPGWELS